MIFGLFSTPEDFSVPVRVTPADAEAEPLLGGQQPGRTGGWRGQKAGFQPIWPPEPEHRVPSNLETSQLPCPRRCIHRDRVQNKDYSSGRGKPARNSLKIKSHVIHCPVRFVSESGLNADTNRKERAEAEINTHPATSLGNVLEQQRFR